MTGFIHHGARDSSEPAGSKTIAVAVVDDHPVVRFGICHVVDGQPDLNVIGDADDSKAALLLVEEKSPDVLLLDLELECQQCSFGLIAKVAQEYPQTKVVIYTSHDAENRVMEAIRSGASAYVIKSSRPERLCEAIRVVADGGTYLDPAIASLVVGRVGRRRERRATNSRELTRRERDVLRGLASGKRNREIAAELFISERTVKFHIKSMFTKMQAKSRTEIVKIAIENGFV